MPLETAEVAVLHAALDDEYRAWATYDRVIRDFGPVRPFTRIREAESRHIAALRGLFERFGLPVPENPWPGRVPAFASPADACRAAADAEIANAALYRRLLASTERTEILRVFRRLAEASLVRHLPAFRRGAARGAEPEAGRCGRRRRRGGAQG